MIKTILIGILFLFINNSNLFCQTKWEHQFDNEIGIRSWQFLANGEFPQDIVELNSSHSYKLTYGTNWLFKSTVRSILNFDNDRTRLFLNEAYFTWRKGKVNLKLGKQVIKWGNLAGFSSLDLFNRYDYYDFLDAQEEELGVWAANWGLSMKNHHLRLRVIPKAANSRLYFKDNNWIKLPNSFTPPSMPDIAIPMSLNSINNVNESSSFTYGLEWNFTIRGAELTFNYVSGRNDIPLRDITLLNRPTVLEYDVNLHYYNMDIFAFNYNQLIGDWTMSSEFSIIRNQRLTANDGMTSDNYASFSFMMDRAFFFDNPEKMFRLLVEYRRTMGSDRDSYSMTDLDHVLDHVLITDLEHQFNYKWTWKYQGILAFEGFSHLHRLGINYKPNNTFSIHVQSDILMGSTSHFFGFYGDRDRISLALKCAL